MPIWKPKSVVDEPLSQVARWRIYRVHWNERNTSNAQMAGSFSDHVVGYCGEGRVSSPIITNDMEKETVTTKSGRVYHVPADLTGYDNDAQYVWSRATRNISVGDIKDVTHLYTGTEEKL
jgi:hypothetical protein